MKRFITLVIVTSLLVVSLNALVMSQERPYEGVKIRVLSQARPSLEVAKKYLSEFEDETGIKVALDTFGEQQRRSKERLDASTGAGTYQVYYVDEANVAQFARNDWILPILKYYPDKYEWSDFSKSAREIASYEGKPYFAPLFLSGDLLFYRKDILQEEGIEEPKTLEELTKAIKKVHNPPNIYGWVSRGERGSGMNVWRWAAFFKAFEGTWFDDDGEPNINSEAAIQATKKYMELLEYGPPGVETSSWSSNIENLRSGKAAFMVDANVFVDWLENPEKSNVVGKIGYAAPPKPLVSAGSTHGFAISKPGCKTEKVREAAGLFIGWVTSKEQETKRLKEGVLGEITRKSTLDHPIMKESMNSDALQATKDMYEVTEMTIMNKPDWPQIGDKLGITLEQLFTGQRTDIQAALNEVNEYAKEVLERK